MFRIISRLRRNQKGVAALEFGLSLPLIFLLLFSVIEVTRFILVAQMVTNVSRTLADLTSQGETLDSTELADLFAAVNFVAKPFDMQTDGRVIISSISKSIGNPVEMNWQECRGDLSEISQIGIPGNTPTLPNGIVRDGYTIIAAEAYYNFEPLLIDWIMPATQIYRANYFRARLGALNTLSGGSGC